MRFFVFVHLFMHVCMQIQSKQQLTYGDYETTQRMCVWISKRNACTYFEIRCHNHSSLKEMYIRDFELHLFYRAEQWKRISATSNDFVFYIDYVCFILIQRIIEVACTKKVIKCMNIYMNHNSKLLSIERWCGYSSVKLKHFMWISMGIKFN